MGEDAPHLDPVKVRELLSRLGPISDEIVLIGGQALNFWANRYERNPELAAEAPFTSKDIDFGGDVEHVRRCAQLLGASHRIFGPNDRSICAGIVTTADGVDLDFVRAPLGLKLSEIQRRAVAFPSLRVMDPIHVMVSRAANVIQIPRETPLALKQLRASVPIAREFIREVLGRNDVKLARKLNEETFRAAATSDGVAVWRRYGIDMFDAIAVDPVLGTKFETIRYPQMRAKLTALRAV